MKKAIVITIPEPCHENWAEMSATEKGKFCGVCTKDVIDLSAKTDEDLVKMLSGKTNVCGRFKKSQLNREVKMERKSGINFGPIAASFMLPLSIMANTLDSGNKSDSKKAFTSLGIGSANKIGFERAQIITTGTITDSNGIALRNVEISSNETETREWTNYKGEYRIVTLDNEMLTFEKEGYINQVKKLSTKSSIITIEMVSSAIEEFMIMGEIMAPPIEKNEINKDLIITKGTVTDDSGLPIPGVNVIIEGTLIGTQTDFDGNYSIQSKPNQKLVFSYVGYMNKVIKLSNINNTIDIEMGSGGLMGAIVINTINSEKYSPIFPFGKPKFIEDPEGDAKREKRKQAAANTVEFKRIQKERRKKL